MIRDEEDFIFSIRSYLIANLNAKITAINTEKGDFTTETITADTEHYVVAGQVPDLPNHSFVQIAIAPEGIQTKNYGGNLRSEITLIIEVVFSNPFNDETYLKSLRYMRALYEVMIDF